MKDWDLACDDGERASKSSILARAYLAKYEKDPDLYWAFMLGYCGQRAEVKRK